MATCIHADSWEGFMKYTVEMGSGAMMHISSLIKIGSGIQKLIGGFADRQTAWRSHKPALGISTKNSCGGRCQVSHGNTVKGL
jgi:hypothetical protein